MSGINKESLKGEQDVVLSELLKNNPTLQQHEKDFLISRISKFDHLDKFKLKRFLLTDSPEPIRDLYKLIRDKLLKQETEENLEKQISQKQKPSEIAKNIFGKLAPREEIKKHVAISLLSNLEYLGGEIPLPPQVRGKAFDTIDHFTSLDQLAQLDRNHVTFSLEENPIIELQGFFKRISDLFNKIDDINKKRGYFRLFMRSPLFNAYLNTGITALRHTEIQPRKVVLNLIFQTDPTYLNSKQFEYTSSISAYLKALVDI
jgi:hypothetical protein